MDAVSPKIMTKQLREMENDRLITRVIKPEVPVCVEYTISEKGKTLVPALRFLAEWGIDNVLRNKVIFDDDVIIPNRNATIS
jgi:DNA-binding HxlR family transcriptional regulator